MMVLVDKEKSTLYDKVKMSTRERKAKSIAMMTVPAIGMPGMLIPNAIARTAPSDAPEDTPRVEPSASGLRRRPCMAPPHSDNEAPTNATQMTRGRRTKTIIDCEIPVGMGRPKRVFQMAVRVSFIGMLTLPAHTHSTITAIMIMANSTYSKNINPSCRLITSSPYGSYPGADRKSAPLTISFCLSNGLICFVDKGIECADSFNKARSGSGYLI